jgi:hypothetical protein
VSNLANNDPMLAANKSLNAEVDAARRNWAVKTSIARQKAVSDSRLRWKEFQAGRAWTGGSSHTDEVPALDHAVCSDDDTAGQQESAGQEYARCEPFRL